MAKTRSWSVKGIDGETRDLARDAARASGMTIGAWIDQAILRMKRNDLPVFPSKGMPGAETASALPVAEPDLPTSQAPANPPPEKPPVKPHGTLTADPLDRLYPADPNSSAAPESSTKASAELPTDELYESAEAAPPVFPETQSASGTASHDSSSVREEDTEGSINTEVPPEYFPAEPRPLAPPRPRPSVLRYAVLGLVFAAILGGGGWLFAEFSSPDRTPTPRKIADAALPVEAPPPIAAAGDGLPAGLPEPIRRIIVEARAGNPEAQFNLGMLHLSGRLGEKSPAEAAKWFGRSAEQGIANAQFNLGVLYQRGEGLPQNDEQAFFWFQSAAEQNYPQAQHNLATAYAEGRGIARNYPKAAEWFAKSAEAGLSQSQFSLGALHEGGLITGEPNLIEARRWYERALAQGDTRASERLAALDAAAPPADTASANTADVAIGRAEIRQIQTLLSRMNFNPGPADGQMGKRTADAIRLYQKFAGMKEDGAPSQELLDDLRAVAGSMSNGG